jgi:hypothetical protein
MLRLVATIFEKLLRRPDLTGMSNTASVFFLGAFAVVEGGMGRSRRYGE